MSYSQNGWAQKDSISIIGDQGSHIVTSEFKSILMNNFSQLGTINIFFFYVILLNSAFLLFKMTEMRNIMQKCPF